MEVKGRQFDYSFGANLNYVPRSEAGISFAELRALADALPLLRAVIETRKDQIAAQNFTVRQRARADLRDASARIDAALEFLSMPDRRHSFADWLRMLLEDVLVIDAATIFDPGRARAAQKLGEERARQGDPGVHGRTRSRVRMAATTRLIRCSRRGRSTSSSRPASRHAKRRERSWGWAERGRRGWIKGRRDWGSSIPITIGRPGSSPRLPMLTLTQPIRSSRSLLLISL